MTDPEVDVEAECYMCGRRVRIRASKDGLQAWENGELIQKALPELNAEVRELLISGTCGACFDKLFAEEEK